MIDHSRRRKAKATMMRMRQKRRDRPLGQRGDAGKEVNIEEPELRVGFIPRIPAEQADGKRRGHLHIGRGAARRSR